MRSETGLAAPAPKWLALDRGTAPAARQQTFDSLGTPLRDVTFVVVDLETTGQAPGASAITEFGAVKVRGGEVLGEFQTLVNPGVPIPPMITVLTGITTAMVLPAPRIESVFPGFLEFAGFDRGSVLVAHNARFDVSFLKAAAADLGFPWPSPTVVDTLALARRALTRDEVPNHKLASLAHLFRTSVTPDHRALSDARATADVLHRLLERLAPFGLLHLEDLRTITDPVPPARRRKSTLADGVPHGPGVYQFIGPSDEVLYVGTATDLRTRVRSYFTAAEKRARIGEMVDLAVAVRTVPCESVLEAQVREVRLIAACDPQYNRRSRRPQRRPWVTLTREAYPRLTIARSLDVADLDTAWGPFGSHRQATEAVEAIQGLVPLRSCTLRLPRMPSPSARTCMAFEAGSSRVRWTSSWTTSGSGSARSRRPNATRTPCSCVSACAPRWWAPHGPRGCAPGRESPSSSRHARRSATGRWCWYVTGDSPVPDGWQRAQIPPVPSPSCARAPNTWNHLASWVR